MMDTHTEPFEPIMPHPKCPHCGKKEAIDRGTYSHYKGPLTCANCRGKYYVDFNSHDGTTLVSPPRPLGDPELLKGLSAGIPKDLYNIYEEATLSLEVGIAKGAALLCRYVIQQALLQKGIPDQSPEKMVNIAHEKKVLCDTAYRLCGVAVFLGGKAGHPQANWLDNIGPDDAKQALLLTRRILLELFNPEELLLAVKKEI
jgi:hypothetical protein